MQPAGAPNRRRRKRSGAVASRSELRREIEVETSNAEETDVQLNVAADRAAPMPGETRVQLSETQRQQFLTQLLKIGWTRRGDFIVAPNETLCLPLVLMRTSELGEFRDGIAQQCAESAEPSSLLGPGALADCTGVLEVLRDFLRNFAASC
jgi:hypothetical protein